MRHVRQRHADSPPDSRVIKLAVKLDMRARHYKQQARTTVLLSDTLIEDGPVEEVQYELMDIPQVGDSLKVNVNTTGNDAI